MGIAVADTGPPHYLVLVGAVDLLPRLFGPVLVPDVVLAELSRPRTPAPVREWLATRPLWLVARPTPPVAGLPLPKLGDGERAAIALAREVGAALLLTDDRAAAAAARAAGFEATGTLGVLVRAAAEDLIELPAAFARLRATNFHCPPTLFDALLEQHRRREDGRS